MINIDGKKYGDQEDHSRWDGKVRFPHPVLASEKPSCLYRSIPRRGSRILVRGAQFGPQGGAWAKNCSKLGFSLKITWKLWFSKNLGGNGGRPQGPPGSASDPAIEDLKGHHKAIVFSLALLLQGAIPHVTLRCHPCLSVAGPPLPPSRALILNSHTLCPGDWQTWLPLWMIQCGGPCKVITWSVIWLPPWSNVTDPHVTQCHQAF